MYTHVYIYIGRQTKTYYNNTLMMETKEIKQIIRKTNIIGKYNMQLKQKKNIYRIRYILYIF